EWIGPRFLDIRDSRLFSIAMAKNPVYSDVGTTAREPFVSRPASRPALSAARSSEIIDFLASFPERGFTLSEIVRATKINVASCHAVLATLTDCGYLTRCPNERTYTLGRALVAIGQAALKSQPLIARAQEA